MDIPIGCVNGREIGELSDFVRKIISDTSYYNQIAKTEESKKFEPEKIRLKIKENANMYIVAKQNGKIVGFCEGYFDAGTFRAEWMGVQKTFRNKGIAEKLIVFLEKELNKYSVHKIWGDSRTNNKESAALLKKLGYEKIAMLEKQWYGQDFYLWQKFI